MKKIFGILAFMLISYSSFAAGNAWFTSAEEAKSYASNHNVPILMVFAGSDWCRPCMALKSTILQSEVFTNYYPEHMAVLYLDFPMHAKNKLSKEMTAQNEKLASKYNPSGFFPNVIMTTLEGKVLGSIKFDHQSPESFIESCEGLIKK